MNRWVRCVWCELYLMPAQFACFALGDCSETTHTCMRCREGICP